MNYSIYFRKTFNLLHTARSR